MILEFLVGCIIGIFIGYKLASLVDIKLKPKGI
jgi:hypothetical protein